MSGVGERRTPLLEVHRRLGARLVPFAGWDMPLAYEGVISEHRAVRSSVGVFDVSHLGKLRIEGTRAGDALQEALTADVASLDKGSACYSLVLTDDGGVVDDVFVYCLGPDRFLLVPNAANVFSVTDHIKRSGGEVTDDWDRWAILALQGPRSFEALEAVFPRTGAGDLPLHGVTGVDFYGEEGLVARTGYTGERGFELFVPASTAARAFGALVAAGAVPVGLGARDTLRLEMGYALYGHELSLEVNPLDVGLSWVLAWDTPFRGRTALSRARGEGAKRKLFGVLCRDKGIPRRGHRVVAGDEVVGEVTSGNFSPTLERGIALALGDRTAVGEPGTSVDVAARGRRIGGDIVRPPFIDKHR